MRYKEAEARRLKNMTRPHHTPARPQLAFRAYEKKAVKVTRLTAMVFAM